MKGGQRIGPPSHSTHLVGSESKDIAGIILASGSSTRYGAQNKLLLPVGGTPMVRRTVGAYLDAHLTPVVVVVGYDAINVESALEGLSIEIVSNSQYRAGQSKALGRGVRSLPPTVSAAVIGVADQPLLTAKVVGRLAALFRETGSLLVVPRYGGQRGNPAVFHRSLFPELLKVTGDEGGRSVLERHRDEIAWLDCEPEIGRDIDTADEYARLCAARKGEPLTAWHPEAD